MNGVILAAFPAEAAVIPPANGDQRARAVSSNRYGGPDLQNLLQSPESGQAGRRHSLDGGVGEAVRRTIRALANDLRGRGRPGAVFAGIPDDGPPSNLAVSDALLMKLVNIRNEGAIVPPPVIAAEKMTANGAPLAADAVLPSDVPPVRCHGSTWMRVGPTARAATLQEERILNGRRSHPNRRFDARPLSGGALSGLDVAAFRGGLPAPRHRQGSLGGERPHLGGTPCRPQDGRLG